jgi:hypothetical protein
VPLGFGDFFFEPGNPLHPDAMELDGENDLGMLDFDSDEIDEFEDDEDEEV